MIESAGGMIPFLCHVFLILFGGFFGFVRWSKKLSHVSMYYFSISREMVIMDCYATSRCLIFSREVPLHKRRKKSGVENIIKKVEESYFVLFATTYIYTYILQNRAS